ncbi:right-handed parallel beta-helix repeat-containing protein [Neobacillus niacini]|uniref:right-handed parallel beta-helix repeat-containing protein n=1 Tax=Neobacillus niacini TaxID=86668 RepID=UPI001C8DEBFC|nr:right-handed parallel beta-helix repeat-containing protein [Neobacillus niacini]MBY0145138.1 right-handed parallel beta-helix repeat-containing protein [Neobacillus niacini]
MKRRILIENKKLLLLLCIFAFVLLSFLLLISTTSKKKDTHIIETTTVPEQASVHTPEEFGANGFDKKADTTALQKAINKGGTIVLKSGATYIIDKPLESNLTIHIKTDKYESATILQKAKDSAFIFDNKSILTTAVTQPISSKQLYIELHSTKGISPGMLLHLKSDKPWYWDDRGYLTKGELHKVTKVDGHKVYLERPLVEGYQAGKGEEVTVTLYPSAALYLENIEFAHPEPYNTIMVKVNNTMNSKLQNVTVKNSKRIGILLHTTYQTEVTNALIDLQTTKDVTSGYGIQDYGGTGTFITDSTFKRIRRGVDFSGDTPSRYGVVENSKSLGYGKGKLASGNSGFGTHSTAEYITFRNNYVEDFNYGFLVRGRDITVEGNTLNGRSISFIAITFGDNVKVIKNEYQSSFNSALDMFILVYDNYKGKIEANQNVIEALDGPFIKGKIGLLESFSIKENDVKYKKK